MERIVKVNDTDDVDSVSVEAEDGKRRRMGGTGTEQEVSESEEILTTKTKAIQIPNENEKILETDRSTLHNLTTTTTTSQLHQSLALASEIESQQFEEHDSTNSEPVVKLSKNEMKRRRKKEKWLAIKHEKRAEEKKKRKQRLAERRLEGLDLGPSRKSLKTNTMKNSCCRIRVAIDLSLDSYMTDRDVTSLLQQLRLSYSTNRRAPNPLQLYFSGLNGKTKEQLDGIGDYTKWDVFRETKNHEELFPKESLVYLTSESPNVLKSLSEDKVYVIGGLVDHNKHKGLCHKLAEEKGIGHAQLPISEFIAMSTRKVLAVNHVFSILLRYTESQDWKQAFLSEIPSRKQPHSRDESNSNQSVSHGIKSTGTGNSDSSEKARREDEDSASGVTRENSNKTDCVLVECSPTVKDIHQHSNADVSAVAVNNCSTIEMSSTDVNANT